MKIKFTDSYADPDAGYLAGKEYDFVDMKRANYFVSHGLALPVEQLIEQHEQHEQHEKKEKAATKVK